jgi:NADPH-dependent 2,4-dienoyl-CoA reductase/sulfur reductase-like enzyme
VAIGCVPNTAWLAGSGLPASDGVECDEYGVAAPGVVAAGDVASWVHGTRGIRSRLEHRMNASEQGAHAARALLAAGTKFTAVPYFWSDQFDVRIQVYGTPIQDADFAVVTGDPGQGRFAGTYRLHGKVVAGLSWNMPREARRLRQLVLDDMSAVTA